MNPLSSAISTPADAGWPSSPSVWLFNERTLDNLNARIPGSIGDAVFYPGEAGSFKETQVSYIDSGIILAQVKSFKSAVSTFNNDKSAYDTKKSSYDTAVDNYSKRESDFFAKAFTPEVKLPERPAVPQRPSAYMLPNLDLSRYVGSSAATWKTKQSEQLNFASLRQGTTNIPDPLFATRTGFVCSSPDTSIAAPVFPDSAHVFGRLGQGTNTHPDSATAFYWGATADSNTPGMLISLFPSTDGDAGIVDAAKFDQLTVKVIAWSALNEYAAPAQPDLPANPKKDPRAAGAATIAVGLMASLAVASSLF